MRKPQDSLRHEETTGLRFPIEAVDLRLKQPEGTIRINGSDDKLPEEDGCRLMERLNRLAPRVSVPVITEAMALPAPGIAQVAVLPMRVIDRRRLRGVKYVISSGRGWWTTNIYEPNAFGCYTQAMPVHRIFEAQHLHIFRSLKNERGQKNSRVIVKMLKDAGRGDVEKTVAFQQWMAEWTARFDVYSRDYLVSNAPEDFDRLGTIPCVDGVQGRPSCYRPEGEWKDAPITLAHNFYDSKAKDYQQQNRRAFVVFLKHEGEIVARCWGYFYGPDLDNVLLSNAYYKKGERQGLRYFLRAVQQAVGQGIYKFSELNERNLPVFVNEGGIQAHLENKPRLTPRPLEFHECVLCGGPAHGEHDHTHPYCASCLTKGELCESCGERFDEEDMQHLNGYSYCSSCYDEIVTECAHCHNETLRDHCSTYIASGDTLYFCSRSCRRSHLADCHQCGEAFVRDEGVGEEFCSEECYCEANEDEATEDSVIQEEVTA